MRIKKLDHIVLTVANIEATCRFYHKALGMEVVTYADNRKALKFGEHLINLHPKTNSYQPKAFKPTPGAADYCLEIEDPLEKVIAELKNGLIDIEDGPIEKIGAHGKMTSIYLRDPDFNLIELSNYHK